MAKMKTVENDNTSLFFAERKPCSEMNRMQGKVSDIDIMSMRSKGLTDTKISHMTGISIEIVNRYIKQQELYKKYSGVF